MCNFTPDPEDPTESTAAETAWHFLRVCPWCGHQWWSLHCVHEGRRECPECKKLPLVMELDEDADYASTVEGRAQFIHLHMSHEIVQWMGRAMRGGQPIQSEQRQFCVECGRPTRLGNGCCLQCLSSSGRNHATDCARLWDLLQISRRSAQR